jgi:hypothetical protein
MAAMNAVEVADGQCDVVRGGGESAEDLHAEWLVSLPWPESIEKLEFYRAAAVSV